LLNPFAPHLSSELWETLAAKFPAISANITEQKWPSHDERLLVENEIEIVLQVNGKFRDKITVPLDASDAALQSAALANKKVQNAVAGRPVRKVIVVPKKLVNIVTG
jgi:leucyl-tRNA synthetase